MIFRFSSPPPRNSDLIITILLLLLLLPVAVAVVFVFVNVVIMVMMMVVIGEDETSIDERMKRLSVVVVAIKK